MKFASRQKRIVSGIDFNKASFKIAKIYTKRVNAQKMLLFDIHLEEYFPDQKSLRTKVKYTKSLEMVKLFDKQLAASWQESNANAPELPEELNITKGNFDTYLAKEKLDAYLLGLSKIPKIEENLVYIEFFHLKHIEVQHAATVKAQTIDLTYLDIDPEPAKIQ